MNINKSTANTMRDKKNYWLLFITSMILLFNAGIINSVVLYRAYHKSVVYMTGNVSFLGRYLADNKMIVFLHVLAIVVGFLIGAIINGILLRKQSFSLDNAYGKSLMLQASFLAFGTFLIANRFPIVHHFDEFFIAIAGGMQNSLTTKYSGAVVRTTHLTGTITDLGIEIGHLLSGKECHPWKIMFFSSSILFFFLGSLFGAHWSDLMNHSYYYLLSPSIIITFLVGLAFLIKFKEKISKAT
ncbi:DUF1275 domain-containing protein [Francisellaceae bacterium]|nr:DUF1275 domain-containing protein [Francisellaceae bacterium]